MSIRRCLPLLTVFALACGSQSKPPTTSTTTSSSTAASTEPSTTPRATPPPSAAPVATDDAMKKLALERVHMLAQFFVAAWEREQIGPNGKSVSHTSCPKPQAQPANLDPAKAIAVPDDAWMKDPGWSCLRFLPSEAHWFQYEIVKPDDTHAKVIARRHDLEIVVELTRTGAKADWKIGNPTERKP